MRFYEPKNIKEIIKEIDIWDSWRSEFKKFVPKFIEEAKQEKNWNEWNRNVFYEYFERSNDQCVSSLKLGYFTNVEKENIKNHWEELSPLLKIIADNQDDPQWDVYLEIKKLIRKYTKDDRRAATNRLIAALQPKLLCTIVKENYLDQLFWTLKHRTTEDVPQYVGGNWFLNSYNILRFFKRELNGIDDMDIITYPWQVREYFRELDIKQAQLNKKQNMEKDFLKQVKNVIFTGAPGTGKTYKAKELAKAMTDFSEDFNNERFMFVQFHPSYDYTDFVEGLRPVKSPEQKEIGFELKDGIFRSLCEKARDDEENDYVIVIDEINRGEISKIFGELFFSIDPGYRGTEGKVKTQYSNLRSEEDQYFYVPENVYIIGTMNDIDRSVESFDFAMRRRFTWVEIKADEQVSMWNGKIEDWKDEALQRMKRLNNAIEEVEGLSSSYHIGPAYFLKLKDYKGDFDKLWNYHIEPLIREYLRGIPNALEKLNNLKSIYSNF
ncbi:MAG: AAA family ATPase [Prolixibacteraceae bacterium]|nr:AAA family ATPase [Prolixibacteraceae bacterium]